MMLDETWDRRLGRKQGLSMQYETSMVSPSEILLPLA